MSVEDGILALVFAETDCKEPLKRTTRLDDLGLDSLDYLNLIVEIERRFDVRFPEALLPKLETIGGLVVAVERLMCH